MLAELGTVPVPVDKELLGYTAQKIDPPFEVVNTSISNSLCFAVAINALISGAGCRSMKDTLMTEMALEPAAAATSSPQGATVSPVSAAV